MEPMNTKNSLGSLIGLRLEFWNGQHWECGCEAHENMTEEKWVELKPIVLGWSCPWRIVASRIEDKSEDSDDSKRNNNN